MMGIWDVFGRPGTIWDNLGCFGIFLKSLVDFGIFLFTRCTFVLFLSLINFVSCIILVLYKNCTFF